MAPLFTSNFQKKWKLSCSLTAHTTSQLDGAGDGKTDGLGDTEGTLDGDTEGILLIGDGLNDGDTDG